MWKPKTIAILSDIHHKKKETLKEYIDQFIKVLVEVGKSNDMLKC